MRGNGKRSFGAVLVSLANRVCHADTIAFGKENPIIINKINFRQFANAAAFLPPDSGVECATLWDDGTTLYSIAGGQVGGWGERERIWVYERLPNGPHDGLNYSGYWAFQGAPSGAVASRLRVDDATLETTDEGWPLYRVVQGEQNSGAMIRWEGVTRAGSALPALWAVDIFSADTGEKVVSLTTAATYHDLAIPAGPFRLLVRVRAPQQEIGTYQWPPPGYREISGEGTDEPARYRWTHPTRGELYYDLRFKVGARPYDATDPIQATLLEEESATETRKIPQWTALLKPFDATGEPLFATGEDSLIRVIVGAGTWDESAVADGARVPCLWRAPLDRVTRAPTAPYEVWHPPVASIRSVGVLEVDDDGALLIGGACSAANGPAPCLLQVQLNADASGDEAAGVTTLSLFYCECADELGKELRSIARTSKGLRTVSPCDSFQLDETRELERRLVPQHPGGRNATTWRNALGEHYVFSAEAADFATDERHPDAHGFVILETGGGRKTGAPIGKQLDSMLAAFAGQLWGVWDENPWDEKAVQHLGSSESGDNWRKIVSWNKSQFDGGAVCAIGDKADGLALWCFGTRGDLAMRPRALRAQGGEVTRHIDSDYFVQRINSVKYGGETLGVGVGLKWDAATGYSREQRLIWTRGDDVNAPVPAPGEPKNADEALDAMPTGTRVSLIALRDYNAAIEGAIAAVGLNLRLRHATIPAHQYEALYPALWLRVDAAEPLLIDEGAAITPAIKAELAIFDLQARELMDRFLPIEADKRVEAVVLLAPDWVLENKELKATF